MCNGNSIFLTSQYYHYADIPSDCIISKMKIFLNFWNTLSKPRRFWDSIEHDQSIAETVLHAIALCIAGTIISSVVLFLIPGTSGDMIARLASRLNFSAPVTIISSMVLLYAVYFVAFTMNALMLFIVAKLLRGSGTFAQTYKAVVYSATPVMLFGMIPLIWSFTTVWMEILKFFGVQRFHQISNIKTIIVMFLADLLLIMTIICIVFFSLFAAQEFKGSRTSKETVSHSSSSSTAFDTPSSAQYDENTYKNDQYHFSIRYPMEWKVYESDPGGRDSQQYISDTVVEFLPPFKAGDAYRSLNGFRILIFQNETLEGYLDHREPASGQEMKRFRDIHPDYEKIRVNNIDGIAYSRFTADMLDSQKIRAFVLQIGAHVFEIEIVETDLPALQQYIDSLKAVPTADLPTSGLTSLTAQKEHLSIGQADAPVAMTMFTDYQVGAARSFWDSTYPQLVERYIEAGKLRIIIRHYPLPFNAMAHFAASMIECARLEDEAAALKLHEALSTRIYPWENDLENWFIVQLRTQPTLNIATIAECDRLGTVNERLKQDVIAAKEYGVTAETGIPQFFLSTTRGEARIHGAKEAHYFFEAIDDLLSSMAGE